MDLDQWIRLFGAVSTTVAVREKSKWLLFCSGLIASTVLLATAAFGFTGRLDFAPHLGVVVLGLLIAAAWIVVQQRLIVECDHWNRILRGIEGQFAGTELHRSIHRLFLGEQVCIPASAWVCGEWNPDAARFPLLTRHLSGRILQWIPGIYAIAFIAVLIAVLVMM
jgi:hypothetical protein